jgi:hypothetical protein
MTNREAQSARAWTALTEAFIDEYLADYEMRGEDEDGRDACHKPTDGEQFLIKDAIMGLLLEAWDAASASAQPDRAQEAVAFTDDEHLAYVNRDGGNCRDCADENGVCPSSGLPCGGREKAIRFVFNALTYGINNGFISSPFPTPPAAPTSETSATASVAELSSDPLGVPPSGSGSPLQPSASTAIPNADARDAARYRWLRAGNYSIGFARSVLNDTPHGIDAAIDAAMEQA